MNRFADVLAATASRLTVPEPARSRILLELAADMEDLYTAYLERGKSDDEARRGVLDHFDLSDEALRELVRVHDTPIQGILNGLSSQAEGKWEKGILAVLVVGVALGFGRVVFQGGILQVSSVFVWPVLAVGAWALGIGWWKGRRLFGTSSSSLRNPSGGIGLILGLVGLEVFFGLAGIWIELYLVALRLAQAPGESLVLLVEWLEMASATLTITLGMALATTLLWFLLAGRARRIERQAAAHLVEP